MRGSVTKTENRSYIEKNTGGILMPRDNNPKRENLLNLALDATERELEQSVNLQAGYNKTEKTWEVIIRYSTS